MVQLFAGEHNNGRSGGGPQWENKPQPVYTPYAQSGQTEKITEGPETKWAQIPPKMVEHRSLWQVGHTDTMEEIRIAFRLNILKIQVLSRHQIRTRYIFERYNNTALILIKLILIYII